MSKSRFYKDSPGLIGSLSETLPDERPIKSLQVVENTSKCPQGYYPVLKTYDEDSDADMLRYQPFLGKRTCRYLCISKSEGMPGRIVSGIKIVSTNDPPPPGYTTMKLTSDTEQRAWRKKQLCYLLTVPPPVGTPPLTDIILCSKLKKAPDGFQYAGEMNGIILCYKVAGSSNGPSPVHAPSPLSQIIPTRRPLEIQNEDDDSNYQNVIINGHNTPDASKRLMRAPPERPPKASALVAELNKLNLQSPSRSPSPRTKGGDESPHDYEILNPVFKPARPAPQIPGAPTVPKKGLALGRKVPPPMSSYNTLGGYSELEGIPFSINAKLDGCSTTSDGWQIPIITKKTWTSLDQKYKYDFLTEKQNLMFISND